MKRLLFASLLATLLGGCVIAPWGYGDHDRGHDRGDSYHRWHDNDRWHGDGRGWPGG